MHCRTSDTSGLDPYIDIWSWNNMVLYGIVKHLPWQKPSFLLFYISSSLASKKIARKRVSSLSFKVRTLLAKSNIFKPSDCSTRASHANLLCRNRSALALCKEPAPPLKEPPKNTTSTGRCHRGGAMRTMEVCAFIIQHCGFERWCCKVIYITAGLVVVSSEHRSLRLASFVPNFLPDFFYASILWNLSNFWNLPQSQNDLNKWCLGDLVFLFLFFSWEIPMENVAVLNFKHAFH